MPELPVFFDRYIKKVDNIELKAAFEKYHPTAIMSELDKIKELGGKVYAPEKWTAKDILQHIIDTERVMSYRAMSFARRDAAALPGFDEETYAKNTLASSRSIDDLMEEWIWLRKSVEKMFMNFSNDMLLRKGFAYKVEINPLSLGFVILGHPLHHYQVLEERYFPLLG